MSEPELGRSVPLEHVLGELIQHTRAMRTFVDEGRGDEIHALLVHREALIGELDARRMATAPTERTADLWRELDTEDRQTLACLEAWRESSRRELGSLGESRLVLKSYRHEPQVSGTFVQLEL